MSNESSYIEFKMNELKAALRADQTQISPLYVSLKFSSDDASLNSDFFIRNAGNRTLGL